VGLHKGDVGREQVRIQIALAKIMMANDRRVAEHRNQSVDQPEDLRGVVVRQDDKPEKIVAARALPCGPSLLNRVYLHGFGSCFGHFSLMLEEQSERGFAPPSDVVHELE